MRIYKTFKFEAAHQLRSLPPQHKCSNVHGHSWEVTVCVDGPMENHDYWVLDYAKLKGAWEALHHELDHKLLNDVHIYLEKMPTSERLGVYIFGKMLTRLQQCGCAGVELVSILVKETCTTGALVMKEDYEKVGAMRFGGF